jgi:bacillolysin
MKTVLSFLFVFTLHLITAQKTIKDIRVDDVEFRNLKELSDYASHRLNLTEPMKLELRDSIKDILGMIHYTFDYFHNGIKFNLANVVVHTLNNSINQIQAIYVDKIQHDESEINEMTAYDFLKEYTESKDYIWLEKNNLYFQNSGLDSSFLIPLKGIYYVPETLSDTNSNFVKSYFYQIYTVSPLSHKQYFISCENGELLYSLNLICDYDGIVDTKYSGSKTVTTDYQNGLYKLHQSDPRCEIEANFEGADIFDTDNIWTATENINFITPSSTVIDRQPALDMYWGTEQFYDYFSEIHNWQSYDNNDSKLKGIYYSDAIDNAEWTGVEARFHQGNVKGTAYTSIDIVGHEFAHGIASTHKQIVYSGESGAINESLSDIWGVCIENYAKPGGNLWLCGDEVVTLNGNNGSRSFIDPKSFSMPNTYQGDYWVSTSDITFDDGGVHYNSSVMNHWFYLLTTGGTGVNDNSNVYNIQGIGMEEAANIVFRAETFSNGGQLYFQDFRANSIQAAKDLYGECSQELKSTIDAWYSVGVGLSAGQLSALELSSPVLANQTDYQFAIGFLSSTSNISATADVKYESNIEISLKPGFESANGSKFHAQIVPCSEGYAKNVIVSNNKPSNEKSTLILDNSFAIEPYPNPMDASIELNNNTNLKIDYYELIDFYGNTLYNGLVEELSLIPVSHLQKGMYILKFVCGSEVITKKMRKL